ncbi:MAG: DUF5658 family protein [Granulosicoccaceae bacterium]
MNSDAHIANGPANTTSDQWDFIEKRCEQNRRRYKLYSIWKALIAPRRFEGRRSGDRRFATLDRYDSGLCTMAVLLVLMSITDSLFTLTLIARGGSEANPFMNYMLQHSIGLFMVVKMVLTAVPAVLLVATHNLMLFDRIRARSILAAMVGMYTGLLLYEVGLLALSTS